MKLLSTFAVLSLGVQAQSASRAGWQRVERAPPTETIDLYIALKPAKSWDEIFNVALNIASPSHSNFRRHLSGDQVSALAEPSDDSKTVVLEWLQRYNISGAIRGGILEANTVVGAVEQLLESEYYSYERDGETILRTPASHIPDIISDHIEFITPTSEWPLRSNKLELRNAVSTRARRNTFAQRADECGSGDEVTPDCVKQVYNITYKPKPDRTSFGVYGTEAASFSETDLKAYLKSYNPDAASAGATYEVVGSGDPGETDGGIEASFETALDTQTLLGIAWPAKGIFYNNGGVFGPTSSRGKTYDRFVSFLQDLIHNDTVPSVVSFSESMPENMMDAAYAQRLCGMMAQVGARGVTLLFSSGNNGPSGDMPTGKHDRIFETEFPASCPFVTAVGGTTDMVDEVGATKKTLAGSGIGGSGFTASGGGFSALFPRPDYQNGIVDKYISDHVPKDYESKSGYNASGRGVPDVSAFSSNVLANVAGLAIGIGGTSAATPIWGAVVALLNDYQAGEGKPALGFLNPWLYELQTGLKDITGGGNNAGDCMEECDLPETPGYDVATGWDPVTGLGSPNVGLLMEVLRTNSSS